LPNDRTREPGFEEWEEVLLLPLPEAGRHGMQNVCVNGKHHRAAEAEAAVWGLISRLLKDPERLRVGLDEMIEQERAGMRGDPDQEAASWLEFIRSRAGATWLPAPGRKGPHGRR
jgi:hypothetical protein